MCDHFGELDPCKLPGYLFYGSTRLDYSSAIQADISKQNFSTCPRHWYVDATIICSRCHNEFQFTAEEQRFWYEELHFYVDSFAKDCPRCRSEIRRLKSLQQQYDMQIAEAIQSNDGELKRQVVAIIDALSQGGVHLPGRIYEKYSILLKQIEHLKRI